MKTRLYKKLFLLLLVLALLLVSLPACAVSKSFTQAETDTWVARCIADFDALYQKDVLHFSQTQIYKNERGEKVVSNAQVWFCGNDFLKEKVDNKENNTHTVFVGGEAYEMRKTGNLSEVWVPKEYPAQTFSRNNTRWEYQDYQFKSIEGKGKETAVTFVSYLGHDNCTLSEQTLHLIFYYEGDVIQRIDSVRTSYSGPNIDTEKVHSVITMQYVFHSTPESEITAKIDAAYQKATGK